MTDLDKLAIIYGTDKSSKVHDYCRKYEKYLPFDRDAKLTIFEIGVLDGSSIKMWKGFYRNSKVIGIDIDKRCIEYHDPENGVIVEIGSQTDPEFLEKMMNKYGPFDMILDDGSHYNEEVVFSFKTLFKSVKSGGVYIVEDSATSYYSKYGGERYKKGTSIEYFKDVVDEVNFFGEILEIEDKETGEIKGSLHRKDGPLIEQFKRKGYDYIGTEIESLNFLNSLILVTKR